MLEENDPAREIINAMVNGPHHPECDAPKITFGGIVTCIESKDRSIWCGKCVRKSNDR